MTLMLFDASFIRRWVLVLQSLSMVTVMGMEVDMVVAMVVAMVVVVMVVVAMVVAMMVAMEVVMEEAMVAAMENDGLPMLRPTVVLDVRG